MVWGDLDTNGDGVLDDGDDFVSVLNLLNEDFASVGVPNAGNTFASTFIIDLGGVTGGAAGVDTLNILGTMGLVESDFIF